MTTPEHLKVNQPRGTGFQPVSDIKTPRHSKLSRLGRRPFLLLALALASTLLLTGCATYVFNGYQYDVVLRYTGKGPISNCKISSTKGVEYEAGFMIPGFDKTMAGPFRHTAADQWTVRWKPATGDEIAKKLDLTTELPKQFEGRLIFVIDAFNNLSHTTADPASR